MWSFSLQPTSLAPHAHSSLPRLLPIFFLSSKAAPLSRRNARPFFQVAQPPQFSFHMSGCAIQQSFVGTCWEGFFSVSVPEVHTNGLKTKQGVLCTSLSGPQRPFYHFYTKIFLLCPLLIIALTNVNCKRKNVPCIHLPAILF